MLPAVQGRSITSLRSIRRQKSATKSDLLHGQRLRARWRDVRGANGIPNVEGDTRDLHRVGGAVVECPRRCNGGDGGVARCHCGTGPTEVRRVTRRPVPRPAGTSVAMVPAHIGHLPVCRSRDLPSRFVLSARRAAPQQHELKEKQVRDQGDDTTYTLHGDCRGSIQEHTFPAPRRIRILTSAVRPCRQSGDRRKESGE